MKKIGIIVEYNPLHNGHLHHIMEARRLSKADYLIAVMSGNFVQRGEPALIDKWSRAKLAIEASVDLVVELPFVYVNQSADTFAFGSIDILNKLKIDELYFGSESNDIDKLLKIANIFETPNYQEILKKYLKLGNSYPSANGKAVYEITKENYTSNDNLGIQYIRAINKINPNIKPLTIQRIHSNYHDLVATDSKIASATAIRKMDNFKNYVPEYCYQMLINSIFHHLSDYFPLIKHQLITNKDLSNIFLVSEGIENRLLKHCHIEDFDTFLNACYTRRHTQNKVRRILINILCNITKEDIKKTNFLNGVTYIRVLAMNDRGRKILNSVKKNEQIKIISKLSEHTDPMLDIEKKVSQIYDSQLASNEFKSLYYKK